MDDLLPRTLGQAAHLLQLDPIALLRAADRAGLVPADPAWDLTFSQADLDTLAGALALPRLQPDPAPTDPGKAVRAAVRALLDGGYRDASRVRADALWRGLSGEAARAVHDAVDRLLAHGLLLRGSGEPLQVSVPAEAVKKLERLAAAKVTLDSLAPAEP